MKKILGIVIIGLLFSTLTSCSDNNDTKEKTSAEIRLEKQTQGVKNCVRTFGQGVYKDKNLSWKLNNCNASE